MHRELFILCCVLLCAKFTSQLKRPQFINKLFNRPSEENVSQFPPVIEFFVQKIQSQYSNYVYEDLSRPPVWNKPVYTLSPEDQALLSSPSSTTGSVAILNENNFEYVDADNSTELFFELIINKNEHENKTSTQNTEGIPESLDETTENLFETVKTSEYPGNKTFVYITPKKPFTTTPKYKENENLMANNKNITLI